MPPYLMVSREFGKVEAACGPMDHDPSMKATSRRTNRQPVDNKGSLIEMIMDLNAFGGDGSEAIPWPINLGAPKP